MADDEVLQEIMKKLENLERENAELKKKIKTKQEEEEERQREERFEELKKKIKGSIEGFKDFKEPVTLEELEQFYAVLGKMYIVRDVKKNIIAQKKGLSLRTVLFGVGVIVAGVILYLIRLTLMG